MYESIVKGQNMMMPGLPEIVQRSYERTSEFSVRC